MLYWPLPFYRIPLDVVPSQYKEIIEHLMEVNLKPQVELENIPAHLAAWLNAYLYVNPDLVLGYL